MKNYIPFFSREQAIKDGVLMDVTPLAQEAGFTVPVAVTKALWKNYIVPHPEATKFQDETGRLWDVLTLAALRAKRQPSDTLLFGVDFLMKGLMIEEVTIKSVIGPGDAGEPVITLMLPGEV